MPIAKTADKAKAQVEQLLEKFDRNVEAYRGSGYNETMARVEFVNSCFEALGWDINNIKGRGEAYKDVVHSWAPKTIHPKSHLWADWP